MAKKKETGILIQQKVYDLTVDYERPLSDLIQAGNYDHLPRDFKVNDFQVVRNTKKKSRVSRKVVIAGFEIEPSTDFVLSALKKEGLTPSDSLTLLTLGEVYPMAQFDSFIHALGSISKDLCLALSSFGGSRVLTMSAAKVSTWLRHCSFAAYRNE